MPKQNEQYIDQEVFYDQLDFLHVPGGRPSEHKLLDWVRKHSFSKKPRGVGGRGKKRQWPAIAAAEYYANSHLQHASGETIERIGNIVQLASMFETCFYAGKKEVLAFAQSFERVGRTYEGTNREDITTIGPLMVVWIRQKRKAIRLLYGKTQPNDEKDMDQFFDSADFARLVFAITHNAFAQGKMPPEAAALKSIPKLSAEASTGITMAAKPRE
jgi:hypothetical protein